MKKDLGWTVGDVDDYQQFYDNTTDSFFGPEDLGQLWYFAFETPGSIWGYKNFAVEPFEVWLGEDPRKIHNDKLEEKIYEFEDAFCKFIGTEDIDTFIDTDGNSSEIPHLLSKFLKELKN